MTVPASMIPYNLWGYECLNEVTCCAGCGSPVVVGNGVTYPMYYDHKGKIKYGWLVFHDCECLLSACHPDHMNHC